MFLIQDGSISAEDYVYTYIPGFEQAGKDDVKIKHLLTHTSGLPAYTNTSGLPTRPNPDALINKICGLSEIYTTGEGYTYSCLNFITLARVVENVIGENLTTFLRRRIWDEIGMIDSTHFPTTEQITRAAPTVASVSRRGRVHDPLAWYYTDYDTEIHACGNAGGFTTVEDESRLLRTLLHKGTLYGKEIFTPLSVELMTTQQTSVATRTFGWDIYSTSNYSNPENHTPETCCIGHTGYTGTFAWFDKYSKTYVILFTNCVYPSDDSANRSAIGSARAQVTRSVLDHLDIYNDVPEEAFVVDNDDGSPDYSESGTWTQSSLTGYMSKTCRYSSAGTSSHADFNFNIAESGLYRIYTWYPENTVGSTLTRYIVNHEGGADQVDINQQVNGGNWVVLGTYNFNNGDYSVRLDAENSSGGTPIADAIMVQCLKIENEIVVDNTDSGYSDSSGFFSSSASPDRYGDSYRACNPVLGETAEWQFSVPYTGLWEILEWHNGLSGAGGRSSSVPFVVNHAGGSDMVYVNEQENSGRWNSLGIYVFNKGSNTVGISSVTDGIVIADAIKARPVSCEVIVDNLDIRYEDSGGFSTVKESSGKYDATYRMCGSGGGRKCILES